MLAANDIPRKGHVQLEGFYVDVHGSGVVKWMISMQKNNNTTETGADIITISTNKKRARTYMIGGHFSDIRIG